MAGKDIIVASQREMKRLHVVQKAIEGSLRQVEAAELLSLSDRQIRRMVRRVREGGAAGIVHRLRGQGSNRRISEKIKAKAIALYRGQYVGFGPTLAAEKLRERNGIEVSEETLRQWLLGSGDWRKERKSRGHRQWRERKGHRGEMVQMDGSHHDWFEGRGPWCVFMGYIDDATGEVFGRFYGYEGTIPAMDSFRRYCRKHGLPVSVYLDRHTTYKAKGTPLFEGDIEGLSQFERAMAELGVEVIHAHSPQAKGRVERLFRTLQDRLVKELRLRGISTIEEANRFLPGYLAEYNRRFAVKAAHDGNLHRPIPKGLNLDAILCIKTERSVRNDFTIAHNGKFYQITERTRASRVTVVERTNGTMAVLFNGASLRFTELANRPQCVRRRAAPATKKSSPGAVVRKSHRWSHYWGHRKHLRNKPKEYGVTNVVLKKPDISTLVEIGHF